ncbi:putative E3 ubiquitin-protein ligase TRIM71-like [Apostichopus japonicus]|uniref:Putative E3 ubiquitin-protein ligase TRIM71-like n=1 Tax=Stichopus japonicus TaxID=307972 RepID=A0A2G8K978_STIJA|nr:putative E3 ubiquitin-protein ligase TRIM71-like [Apostichopus japonicus]
MSGELNTVSRTCEFCFQSKQKTHQLRCKHVLCGSWTTISPSNFQNTNVEYVTIRRIPARRNSVSQTNPSYTVASTSQDEFFNVRATMRILQVTLSKTAHCVDCRMDICQNCVEQHSKMAVLQNHKIESHKRNIQNSPTAEPTIYCREHIEEVANGFCRTCLGTRVCDLCIQASHIGHHVELTHPLSSTSPKPPMTFDELLRETTSFTITFCKREPFSSR